jgi:Copper type II ascorbate-dependent monooxygenase, C-terminal domain
VLAAAAVVLVPAAATLGSRAPASRTAKLPKPTYYQDVKPILDSRCAGCHFSGGIAPFALQTYAQARRNRTAIAHAVHMRHMPPWFADSRLRAYKYDPTLSAAQIRTITRWAATGAARGDATRPGRPLPSVTPPAIRADIQLLMSEAYTPSVRDGRDDYRCFVLPWSPSASTFMTGFNVRPGVPKEVHHMIVFLARPADAATVEAWERADSTPGYSCYGGPSLTGDDQIPANFLAGWVPGSGGSALPAGTGVEIVPGARLILQVHYNLDNVRPAPDRSTVEFQLADSVAKRGSYVPLVDFRWLAIRQTFRIQAGRKRNVHTVTLDPRSFLPFIGARIDVSNGFTIHSVLHHMHLLGKRGDIALVRANGRRVPLLSIRDWHFHWQREYQLARPEPFAPGDRLSLRCEHDNTAANQPFVNGRRQRPRTIFWGENSTDEMCISFLYVTER